MNKFVIIGKKWFDKLYGNTYHSVVVIDVKTNECIVDVPFSYGYGEQWKHTAYDYLVNKKIVKEKDRHNHELNRKRFIYVCSDVQRKKDL